MRVAKRRLTMPVRSARDGQRRTAALVNGRALMDLHLNHVDSAAARASVEVARKYCSTALFNHCARSFFLAADAGRQRGMEVDDELLYVAAMLHDIGLTAPFDSHTLPFEHAGGELAWVFAAGAGWPPTRRARLGQVIVRHMSPEVDPDEDPEGHLLEIATSYDIAGRGGELWDGGFLRDLVVAYPRLTIASDFAASFDRQAARKPGSPAARAVRGGIRQALADHPMG